MAGSQSKAKKITLTALIAMIFTTIFGFSNIPTGYMMMGYAAIPWYILAGITFFIPYALMVSEYGMAFKNEKGGIFVWMSRSVSKRYGFMGMFMWYTAFIIYFVNVSSVFFMKLSAFIFGEDTTASWSLIGLNPNQTVGVYAILLILLITVICSKGIKNISGLAKIGGMAIIAVELSIIVGSIIVLVSNHGHFAEPISAGSFVKSPNTDYLSLLGMLSFVTMAISAFGGIEATAGLVDKTESTSKIPKAILGAVIIITISYALLIFCLGTFVNWKETLGVDNVNLANVQYVIMYSLGYKVGASLGAAGSAAVIGSWFTRFYGLACSAMTLGSITVFFYGPMTQLIEGTPKEIWPKWLVEKDEKTGILVKAMWVQSAIICLFLLVISFGGTSVNSFWNLIILMTNVAMTIPYIFVAAAFPFFKRNQNIKKPLQIFKSKRSTTIWTVIVVCSIGFANIFTIIKPAFSGDITSTILQILGPTLFALFGLLLYRKYRIGVEHEEDKVLLAD